MRLDAKALICLLGISLGAGCGGGGGGGGGGTGGGGTGGGSGGGGSSGGDSTPGSWKSVGASDLPALNGIYGFGANDMVAVGNSSNILRWNGSSWVTQNSATGGIDLLAVWGATPSDIWAVGEDGSGGAAYHWNGSSWELKFDHNNALLGGKPLRSVWGSGPSDVWMVGENYSTGVAIHWDGANLVKYDRRDGTSLMPGLYAVWGADADHVWAVGQSNSGGIILSWDPAAHEWKKVLEGNDTDFDLQWLESVWGTSATDVWAGGTGSLARWNGSEWKVEKCQRTLTDLAEIEVGKTLSLCPEIESMWGTSSTNLWASANALAGGDGYITHWDGTSWKVEWYDIANLGAMWGTSADNVWAAGYSILGPGVLIHSRE